MRKLKEMSQEMYKELQREFQTEIDEPPSRQSPERTPAPVVTLPAQNRSLKPLDGTLLEQFQSVRRGRSLGHRTGNHIVAVYRPIKEALLRKSLLSVMK